MASPKVIIVSKTPEKLSLRNMDVGDMFVSGRRLPGKEITGEFHHGLYIITKAPQNSEPCEVMDLYRQTKKFFHVDTVVFPVSAEIHFSYLGEE